MRLPFLTLLTSLLLASLLRADVTLGTPFQDHAVLQHGKPLPIWGRAAPGETIRLRLGDNAPAQTAADATGRWQVELPALPVSTEPQTLVVEGHNRLEVNDILIGEVWLCAGQSNMEFRLRHASEAQPAIDTAQYPLVRQLKIDRNPQAEPQETAPAQWTVCRPETAADFSAVGFYFARDLARRLQVPVGIITSAHGNSLVEAWMSPAALGDTSHLSAETLPHRQPSALYHGMIRPLLPYAMRGVLWYQGESNASRATGYGSSFRTLIGQWRHDFAQPDLFFFWVQLPNLERIYPPGTADGWRELRSQQASALVLPRTGQAVTLDIGDPQDIHPTHKRPVGERLARLALHRAYGHALEDSGPVPVALEAREGSLAVRFSHASGLHLRHDAPEAFELAGEDGQYVPATSVTVTGEGKLAVSATAVPAPVAVRYAWSANPTATLFNEPGLPAAPFQARVR
ncbi:MAG: sialate O-acetylesterase [Verrucomicrobiota bacterium JB022]|nr:sialate O-acetylesterase [Verrucomicrobiota bacterium JB022]